MLRMFFQFLSLVGVRVSSEICNDTPCNASNITWQRVEVLPESAVVT